MSEAPKRVAIVALGPSWHDYVHLVEGLGGRSAFCDEVWAINSFGDVIACDRVFHMDDVRIQESRAPDNTKIAAMLAWLRKHPGPVYTSRPHPDYPGLVAFPLEAVINATGGNYFNSTPAYAIALAIAIGVKELSLFGMDYTWPNAHEAERGRACVEFWLGIAHARGMTYRIAEHSTLMDANCPKAQRFYGYDTLDVALAVADGRVTVDLTPRDQAPTAAEIEARYDHSKPPSEILPWPKTVSRR